MKRARRRAVPSLRDREKDAKDLVRSPWVEIILIASTAIVFFQARHFEFVNWDDPQYITENPNVQDGLTWQSVWWALTTGYTPYWHPVTWLSHLVDVQFFGFDAGAHHLVNAVIHVLNSVLLFHWMGRLTGRAGAAAVVAAVFAVHPLHVESVAWISERKDVLSTFFVLLTLQAYVVYAKHGKPSWYIGALGSFVFALMSKPMVVTLPLVLLLLDFWPLCRLESTGKWSAAWRRIVFLEKLPFLAAAVAISIVTLTIQLQVGAVAPLAALPIHLRVSNALVSYVAYLRMSVWPMNLAAFYPLHPPSLWIVVGAALGLLTVSAVAILWRHRYPSLFVGWFWYLITLAPVIGFVQAGEQALADRFMYLPLIGLLMIVTWIIAGLLGNWPAGRRVAQLTAVIGVVLYTMLARAQAEIWADSISLWRHALSVTSGNYKAHEKLGEALREHGQLDEAAASFRMALAVAPPGSPLYAAIIRNHLGLVLIQQGKTDDAIVELEHAVRLNPKFTEAHLNLGNALAEQGRLADALSHLTTAIQLEPSLVEAQIGSGNALLKQNKAGEAAPHFRKAIQLKPGLAQAHTGLGSALAMQGFLDGAVVEYREALRLDPQSSITHYDLAIILIKQERLDEARQHLETALAIDPTFRAAREAYQYIQKLKGQMAAGKGKRRGSCPDHSSFGLMSPTFVSS